MSKSPEEFAHKEWIGNVQPVGLVVSTPAMLEAQCYVNKNIMAEHTRFLDCLPRDKHDEIIPEIRDLPEFAQKVLEWEPEDLQEVPPKVALTSDMEPLEVVLPQYHERLRPTHAVPFFKPKENENPWLMLIQELPTGIALDDQTEGDSASHWHATPQAKFERLLRETGVSIGLLFNGTQIRLVYAPRGESSGHATFNVHEMAQVAGRSMFAALHMLLNAERMFSLGEKQRLPFILENSRKYQNTVSTKLAEQVLAALYELMRGFQAADDVRNGELLKDVLASDPNHVYGGLLRVLMRLVFVMYAEDRDLLSSDSVYSNYYSVTGLFNRLREDAGRHPDTMNQRFGAWSQLITLFRLIYEGGQHGDFKLPARKGYLFDPERYPFLEGRTRSVGNYASDEDRAAAMLGVPRVSDGVVYNVLRNLLILDGERLSYRTLDVEQIGSVYETVMGFNLEVAEGRSIAIKPIKSHGAPATINLDALLETPGKDRAKWLKEHSDQTLGKEAAKQLKEASTIEELLAALDKKIQKKVTPRIVPGGAIVLQPSDERRRSGSHYTPRSLTEPIVRTTLEPILKQLANPEADLPEVYEPTRDDKRRYTKGELEARVRLSERAIEVAKLARNIGTPHPSQILDLKICDPAMGSGAFLVETCRQLGDELIKAWYAHDLVPSDIPPDEDEVLYARRLVAQRCLYGVDKNPMAVDLAKLSLWLVTLAKDHPFTFLDHSLRHGDSLVGLTRRQIIGFHWEPKKQKQFGEDLIKKRLDRATEARAKILNAREDVPYRVQETRLANADEALSVVRLTGDACVSAFFAGSKNKEREDKCDSLFGLVSDWYSSGFDLAKLDPIQEAVDRLRSGEHPVPPFHWEIEFPEVFNRQNGGFDTFIGNPPFAGRSSIYENSRIGYLDWRKLIHEESHGNADLVAYFFRRSFSLLRQTGCFGLIATNTIAQGDTRSTGLRWICTHGGTIYSARKRYQWPGLAAVIVSVVHVTRQQSSGPFSLDGRDVQRITAFLFHAGTHDDPYPLKESTGNAFQGCVVVGIGFTFDDTDSTGKATPIAEMHQLIEANDRNAERVFPYIGGEEVNDHPRHAFHRYIINFGDMSEQEAASWPDLLHIVEEKVRPEREAKSHESKDKAKRAEKWWQFSRTAKDLYETIASRQLKRVLVISQVTQYVAFAFLPTDVVFSHRLYVVTFDTYDVFAMLQSRAHESWALFFGSSLESRFMYAVTSCFNTFPFAHSSEILEQRGNDYYEFRASIMDEHSEGLTKIYNRFHDPHEKSPEIQKLRELHDEMDRAVLEAYGWHDLAETATCEFLLEYEEEEEDGKKSKKKKPWRYRWPDDFRDEVLARLLELNEQRHQEELLTGAGEKAVDEHEASIERRSKTRKKQESNQTKELF